MTKKPQKSPRTAAKKSAKSAPPHPITHGKSLIYGDCLEVMNRWLAEGHGGKVDLIYLDPPFNSNAKYGILYGKESGNGADAAAIAFNDTWHWNPAAAERMDDLSREYSDSVKRTMEGLQAMLGDSGMLAYLSYMAQRLIRCRDMLAEDGSIYLHCDPTASHYLKALMDAIFGAKNFRNEIVWHYATGGASERHYARKHDIILFYSKGDEYYFGSHKVRMPRTPEVLRRIASGIAGATRATTATKLPVDVFTDINALNAMARERTGYPTQKPVALLERIISASSKKGDLVLDPFCGCGTTVVAANKLGRKWAGIDIAPFTVELISRARLHDIRKKIHIEGIPRDMKGARLLAETPFKFEAWAIALTPGLYPNEKQTGDGGVDGRGWLEHDIEGASKQPAAKTPYVIAQVTKSPGADLNKIRALHSSMKEKNALFGVYITLEKIKMTKSVSEIIAAAGKVKDGAREYPRLQCWSVADHFANRPANLPPLRLAKAELRGAAKTSPAQGDIELKENAEND